MQTITASLYDESNRHSDQFRQMVYFNDVASLLGRGLFRAFFVQTRRAANSIKYLPLRHRENLSTLVVEIFQREFLYA